MAMVSTTGPTEVNSKVTGRRTKSQAWVFISGKMGGYTRATGNKIICTDKVFTNGLMVESMKEAILTTRKKDLEYTLTQMAAATEAIGKTESNMAKEYLSAQKVYQERANGKTVSVYTGVMK